MLRANIGNHIVKFPSRLAGVPVSMGQPASGNPAGKGEGSREPTISNSIAGRGAATTRRRRQGMDQLRRLPVHQVGRTQSRNDFASRFLVGLLRVPARRFSASRALGLCCLDEIGRILRRGEPERFAGLGDRDRRSVSARSSERKGGLEDRLPDPYSDTGGAGSSSESFRLCASDEFCRRLARRVRACFR